MKFAVAYADYKNPEVKLTFVEADDPVTALVEGARELIEASDRDPWINSFLKKPVPPAEYASRIEEIQAAFQFVSMGVTVRPFSWAWDKPAGGF